MKAIICSRYGSPDVLRLREVEKPSPQEDEVLIQIHAASLNSRDLRMLRANPFFMRLKPGGLFRPKNKILGADVAGRVEATGSSVKQFQPGDEVFGFLPSATGRGTFAEYVCARENFIALKPANLSFEQAAAVPLAAMTALQGLRDKGNIQPGQKVLIKWRVWRCGVVRSANCQGFGAEVTAVCSSRNMEMVRSLGADYVIDYEKEDFTQKGQQYDLLLAVNGYHPLSDYLKALKPEGTLVILGGSLVTLFQAASNEKRISNTGGQKTCIATLEQNQEGSDLFKRIS